MYTMMIADDEPIARKSLELFIRKEFPDIEVVSAAGNGIEMLEQIENLKPDMAIVDINMPGIDGISAIALLKSRGIRTHFVINTAYSGFEYVKNALNMKVDGYLLKPGVHEESVSTIRQVCDNISREKDENRKNLQMHTFFRTVSPMLENEILLSVCSGVPAEKEFQSYCEVNDIRFNGGCILTLMNSAGSITRKKEIRALVDDALRSVCDHMLLILENTLTLMILLPEKMSRAQGDAWADDVAELVSESLFRGLGIRYALGRGRFCEQFADLPEAYRQSLEAIRGNGAPQDAAAGGADGDNGASIQYYVQSAVRFIDGHYQEDISLDRVAAEIGISPFYLSRLMKQVNGITLIEYLTDVRVRRAKEIALETELPIAEVAQKCGYSNLSYFYKVFKKATGMTIGEFRKAAREGREP